MTPTVRRAGWIAGLLLAIGLVVPRTGGAQTTCEVNNQATCTIQDPTMTITLTISRAARLSVGGATVALPVPSALGVEGAPGVPVAYPVTVQSNTPWTLGVLSLATVWTGTPIATARQNKPSTDLEWNNPAVNGTFTAVSASAATAASGTATAATVVSLNLRVRYSFLADLPGTYTLPLQLLLTAP